ncbi:DUF11 domain-containing protein [Variovorax sp. PDC80]|uniref:prealbumin-like fold domain-containing protein n=1 Tax=Variovorax sp. PDC80 TaxID=1882827 RepID=UPI000B87DAE9|nr:DUF11 domain-containing protein [Variovorax sp. PDC80]
MTFSLFAGKGFSAISIRKCFGHSWKRRAVAVLGSALLQAAFAQQNTSAMENAYGGTLSPTVSGDKRTASLPLMLNYDNPRGGGFAILEGEDANTGRTPLTVTMRTVSGNFSFPQGGYFAFEGPESLFTSQNSPTGTGIGAANGFFRGEATSHAFPESVVAVPEVAVIEISFNRPVDDPVIHLRGLISGTNYPLDTPPDFRWHSLQIHSLELLSPGSLQRLSGNWNFAVEGNFIKNNTDATVGGRGAYAHCSQDDACGSVRVLGKNISTIRFRFGAKSYAPIPGTDRWYGRLRVFFSFSLNTPPIVGPVKTSRGGVGKFDFNYTNFTQTSGSIETKTKDTATHARVLRPVLPTPGELKISENAQAPWVLSSIKCSLFPTQLANLLGTLFSPQYDMATGTVTIPRASELRNSEIICAYVNSKLPTVAIQKKTLGAPGGGGPFNFTADNLDAQPAPITTSAANTATPAAPPAVFVTKLGDPVTLTEDPAPGYVLTGVTCTDTDTANSSNPANRPINFARGQPIVIPAPSASPPATEVSLRPGAKFLCVFTNTAGAELSIVKSLEETSVKPGQTVEYTITVKSLGITPVTGALVKDKPGAGLTCAGTGRVTITGDGVPPGTFTVAQLTGAGIPLGTLAKDQSAVLKFSCTVNP